METAEEGVTNGIFVIIMIVIHLALYGLNLRYAVSLDRKDFKKFGAVSTLMNNSSKKPK